MNKPISEGIENFDTLINEIRAMAVAGYNPTNILDSLISKKGIEGKAQLMVLFRKAFDIELRDVSCIGGWWNDGNSELGDEAINNNLSPHLRTWVSNAVSK